MIVNSCQKDSPRGVKIRTEPFTDVYEVHSEIGRGKYAVVKRCVCRSTGLNYAAKFLHKRRRGRDCRHEALHEVDMLQLTKDNDRIIQLIEVFETSHDLVLVTEFVRGGELFQHIDIEGRVDERHCVRLMRQILEAVNYLHTHNILHMDIKPQNILLTDSLPVGDVKLCDLGLARPFNCGDDVIELVGTLDYVAPEVLDYVSVDAACDMWSVGVLAYVMLTGCSPFAGDSRQETLLNISQVNLEFPAELFDSVSPQAVDFIQHLLVKNSRERLTARDCLQHAWLDSASDNSFSSAVSAAALVCAPPVAVAAAAALSTLVTLTGDPHSCVCAAVVPPVAQSVSCSTSMPPPPRSSCCRSGASSSTDSPSGQRRALVATLNVDEVMTTHEPAKKCRCDVSDDDNDDSVTTNNNNNDNSSHRRRHATDKENTAATSHRLEAAAVLRCDLGLEHVANDEVVVRPTSMLPVVCSEPVYSVAATSVTLSSCLLATCVNISVA